MLPEKLGTLALSLERTGHGAIALFDRQGRLVFRDPEMALSWEQRDELSRLPELRDVLVGREALVSYDSQVDGQRRVAGIAPVGAIGWAVRASRPEAEVITPVLEDLFRDAGAFLAAALGALLVAILTSRSLTRPVSRLREHAIALGEGDLSRRVPVAGPTELADLAATFNKMAQMLQLQQEELQAQNEELQSQSEELQTQNEELQSQSEELQAQNEELRALSEELQRHQAQLSQHAAELQAANSELEAFSYSVSHDLRAPLRTIDGFSKALLEDYADQLDEQGKEYLRWVREGSQKMGRLIDDMLTLSRATRSELRREPVDLSALAAAVAGELRQAEPERRVDLDITLGLVAEGDARLLRQVLENLLGNAWKFTRNRETAHIHFGAVSQNGSRAYFVRDDGAGFDPQYAGKLFGTFQRLHAESEFPGSGIGLATVQRIISRHGGRVWAEGQVEKGAIFYFTLWDRMT